VKKRFLRSHTGCDTIRGPRPAFRRGNHPRPYGIQCNIPAEFEKIGVLFDNKSLVTALEEVPNAVMASIIFLCIYAIELTHTLGEICLGCFYQEVIMVAHEAVRINKPLIALDHIGKGHEKHPVVFSIGKDVLSGIPPGSYMVETTFKFYSYWSSHKEYSLYRMANSKTCPSLPSFPVIHLYG